MAKTHKRTTMTARQLAEDYLAHQITRDVTRTSTRHHLNQLLALYGGWQARRVGAAQMQAFLAAQKERGVMATTSHHRVRLWPVSGCAAPGHGALIRPRGPRLRACIKWPRRISGV